MSNIELAKTVLLQGEKRLNSQLQMALEADSRAISVANIFATQAAAALAGILAAAGFDKLSIDLMIALGMVGAGATIACFLCVKAAAPCGFNPAGSRPDNWWSDNVEEKEFYDCLKKESMNYHKYITWNREKMQSRALLVQIGINIGYATPILSIITFSVLHYLLF